MLSTEARKIKALLWLIAACKKYGKIRVENYYDYVEEELKLAHNTGLAILSRLDELGLVRRITVRELDCEHLWKYIEWLVERV